MKTLRVLRFKQSLKSKTKNMKKIIYILTIVTLLYSCSSETEKYQNNRTNIIDCKDKIKEIKTEPLIFSDICKLYVIDKYLIILDAKPLEYYLHLFDITTFKYISSFGLHGQGPKELTNPGDVIPNKKGRTFFIIDYGKDKLLAYNLDSVLANPKDYSPKIKTKIGKKEFPAQYTYVNDTLSIARIIRPTGNSGFNEIRAKWNMKTGEITPMKYTHPEIKRRRTTFAFSKKHNIYVECYNHHDLMTIADIDGNLICNVYGVRWKNLDSKEEWHFQDVLFIDDYIVASYSGKRTYSDDRFPTKILVFNIKGDYLKTLDIGYSLSGFNYDEYKHRLIFNLEDEMQFAYLDLDGII